MAGALHITKAAVCHDLKVAFEPLHTSLAAPDTVMGIFAFGAADIHAPRIPMCNLNFGQLEDTALEVWRTTDPVQRLTHRGITLSQTDAYIFGLVEVPADDDILVDTAHRAYLDIFQCCKDLGYPHLYRMWNYIPDINGPDAYGEERYRAFCKGRATAFFDTGHFPEDFLPAGTGIGTHSGELTIIFLAGRHRPCINLENPQQVPAYRYPRLYGPRSPSFARGTYLADAGGRHFFVSGTSSILGHRTVYENDVAMQCRVSLDNIAALLHADNLSRYGIEGSATLQQMKGIRVYLRHPKDLETVRRLCDAVFTEQAVYVAADICRDDLMVEIEGYVPMAALS